MFIFEPSFPVVILQYVCSLSENVMFQSCCFFLMIKSFVINRSVLALGHIKQKQQFKGLNVSRKICRFQKAHCFCLFAFKHTVCNWILISWFILGEQNNLGKEAPLAPLIVCAWWCHILPLSCLFVFLHVCMLPLSLSVLRASGAELLDWRIRGEAVLAESH